MPGVKGRSGGRNRKPTALKILQGNPGRRPLKPDNEPQPTPAIPSCPDELSDLAKREWNRVAVELHALGVVSEIDRAALAAYASAYGSFIECEAMMRRTSSFIVIRDDEGRPIDLKPSGLVRARDRAQMMMLRSTSLA